jgi:hypothetical protein
MMALAVDRIACTWLGARPHQSTKHLGDRGGGGFWLLASGAARCLS